MRCLIVQPPVNILSAVFPLQIKRKRQNPHSLKQIKFSQLWRSWKPFLKVREKFFVIPFLTVTDIKHVFQTPGKKRIFIKKKNFWEREKRRNSQVRTRKISLLRKFSKFKISIWKVEKYLKINLQSKKLRIKRRKKFKKTGDLPSSGIAKEEGRRKYRVKNQYFLSEKTRTKERKTEPRTIN